MGIRPYDMIGMCVRQTSICIGYACVYGWDCVILKASKTGVGVCAVKRVLWAFLMCAALLLSGCGIDGRTETAPLTEPPATSVQVPTVITENQLGTVEGYDYELWKDRGTTDMTLSGGAAFTCNWSDINNALFRVGKKFDCTQSWKEIGTITIDYAADYYPVGNSYLCVYGWTREPLVEYYVVQSWGNWRPPGAEAIATVEVGDSTYDIYETERVNQPSIDGTQTFKQYWSVRKGKRTEDIICLTDHFRMWEEQGLELGKLYEVALTVEGYQSSGTAKVYHNEIRIDSTGP